MSTTSVHGPLPALDELVRGGGPQVRIPGGRTACSRADGHLAVFGRDGWEYDFWQVREKPAGGGTLLVSHGGRTRADGDGLESDATAAEFGLAAGVIRGDQMKAGLIDHALFVHVRCTSGRSVYPAAPGTTGSVCSHAGQSDAGAPPLGARLWLDMTPPDRRAAGAGVEEDDPARAPPLRAHVGDTTGGRVSWGLQALSGSTYTSFGKPDPWVEFARRAGVERSDGLYYFDVDSGVDWARHLKVVDPCEARGSC